MGKKWARLMLPAMIVLLLTGCLFRTPDELYKKPEKSAGYDRLVSAIQLVRLQLTAENGVAVEDAVIVSGDNTATIQLQNLDGDPAGERESAVVFLRVPGVERSLKIIVFTRSGEDYQVSGIVEGDGTAIYSVDYVDLNGVGGKELVVNWQVSTGVYQLGAYTLDEVTVSAVVDGNSGGGSSAGAGVDRSSLLATQLLWTDCSAATEGPTNYSSGYRLLDIDQDTRTEIAVVRIDPAGVGSQVEVYGWNDGKVESLGSAGLSSGAVTLNRVRSNYLSGEYYPPAIYLSCTLVDGTRAIEVFAYQEVEKDQPWQLVNLSIDPETGISRNCLKDYTEVNPTDINGDVVLELPAPQPVIAPGGTGAAFWLIDWYQYGADGGRQQVMTTYHNVQDGWYLKIPDSWKGKIAISRNDSVNGQRQVVFSYLNETDEAPTPFLSIYRLTGSNRASRAEETGRFTLREEGEVIYAARFYEGDWNCGLDENDLLTNNFQTIQTNWYGW